MLPRKFFAAAFLLFFAAKLSGKNQRFHHVKFQKTYDIIYPWEADVLLIEGRAEMYQTGDKVVYGAHGVCVVAGQQMQIINRRKENFLVLEPVGQEGSRYMIPMDNHSAMGRVRSMMTREELENLLQSSETKSDCWIPDENRRKQTYRELIGSADTVRLMQMVHTLYLHKASQVASGRKVHLCDDNFLRDAEKLLAGELAVVLNIQQDEARQYLRAKLK